MFLRTSKTCAIKQYGLDLAHHYTSLMLSWDGLLKKTGVELELLADLEEKEWMSDYQKSLLNDLELKPGDSDKLLLTLQHKNNYVVYYQNLQFYLKQGMKL